MKGISVAVERAGAIQADAINTMLLDVLARFTEQMQEMFGGQMKGMGDLLLQTTQSMQETTSRFERLATSVDSAGKNVTDAMAVVGQLHDQARDTAERHHEQSARFADQTGATVMGLTKEVENLLRQSGETSRSLQGSVAAIGDVTRDAIVRMNSGAELLYVASREFAKAGEGVIASMKGSSGAIDRIQAATLSLSSAMNGTTEAVAELQEESGGIRHDSYGSQNHHAERQKRSFHDIGSGRKAAGRCFPVRACAEAIGRLPARHQ